MGNHVERSDTGAEASNLRPSRRRFLTWTAASAGGIALARLNPSLLRATKHNAARTSHGVSAPAETDAASGTQIVWGNTEDTIGFMSLMPLETQESMLVKLLFDPLLTIAPNNTLVPVLAKSLPHVSPDSLTYTFTLHPNARWSDGHPVTADDVAFTYTAMSDPRYAAAAFPFYGQANQYIASATAQDQSTAVVKLKSYLASFLSFYCTYFAVMPSHILGSIDPSQLQSAPFNSNPTATSGMFDFVRWVKGQDVLMTRNKSYYLGPTPVETFVAKVVTNSSSLTGEISTGEVDIAVVDPAQASTVKSYADAKTVNIDTGTMVEVYLQLDPSKSVSKLFSDVSVRQALMYALDREQIVKSVFFGLADVAVSPIPPILSGFDSTTVQKYPYNPSKAKKMLDAAGWTLNSNGIREKDGVPFLFNLITLSGNDAFATLAAAMQGNWHDVGVNATLSSETEASIINIWVNTREFDAFINTTNYTGTEPDFQSLYSSNSTGPGGINAMDYRSPTVDALINDSSSSPSLSTRKSAYVKIQEQLMKDLPTLPILVQKDLFGVNRRVKDLSLNFNRFLSGRWVYDLRASNS